MHVRDLAHKNSNTVGNVLRAAFVGSSAYLETCQKVTNAVTNYSASIGDLSAALDVALLNRSREMEDSITSQLRQLSLSAETQFSMLESIAKHLHEDRLGIIIITMLLLTSG